MFCTFINIKVEVKSPSYRHTIGENNQLCGGLCASRRVTGHTLIHARIRLNHTQDTQTAAIDQLEIVAWNDGIAVLEPGYDGRRVGDSSTGQSHVTVDQSRGVAWTRYDPWSN